MKRYENVLNSMKSIERSESITACSFLSLDTGPSPDPYVYNWTAWTEDSDWGNGTRHGHHGKPFPHPPKWNFVYVFHTLGWTLTNPLSFFFTFPSNFKFFLFPYSITENYNTGSLATVTLLTFLSWSGG